MTELGQSIACAADEVPSDLMSLGLVAEARPKSLRSKCQQGEPALSRHASLLDPGQDASASEAGNSGMRACQRPDLIGTEAEM